MGAGTGPSNSMPLRPNSPTKRPAEPPRGAAAAFIEKPFPLPRLVRLGAQQREVGKRRQAGGAAFAQGLLGKREITLFGQLDQQRMVGQVGLDDHLARLL